MSEDDLLAYCLAKPGAWRDQPWEDSVVAKVADKVFAFIGLRSPNTVWLKCGRDAEDAIEWRERYPEHVTVAPYIGRYGWNCFVITGAIPADEIFDQVDASYDSVVYRLPKTKRPGHIPTARPTKEH